MARMEGGSSKAICDPPSDARVTNLTISEGQFAKVGQQVFPLIDSRTGDIWPKPNVSP